MSKKKKPYHGSKAFFTAALTGIFKKERVEVIDEETGEIHKRTKKTRVPETLLGLRSYASGFDKEHGYDLTQVAHWTPAMKGKVTRYYNAMIELQARQNYVFRTQNEKHLKTAQKVSQHPPKMPAFKVAFVPFTPPLKDPDFKPKLKFIGETMIVKGKYHEKHVAPIDFVKFVQDPDETIRLAVKSLGDARSYQIQAGMYQIATSFNDWKQVAKETKRLAEKYKVVKGMKGDGPGSKNHDPAKWLNGVVGYKFDKGGKGDKVARLQFDQNYGKEGVQAKTRKTRQEIQKAYRKMMHKFGK